ncbi:hypothetical protein Drose_04090 [Dactylosporangium roseum]|uniref:Uncharacterized protein n=1 Tax=Dactylosporangium roseum TaxID=47989 RepID=A0ABY5ZAR8_9ACTN|nr:hypothetical protein [Dactylosporangium roseum]UWZ37469.1 hypothetical protein Drose_04090 [Dactylosporangium roseum]
MAQTYFRVQSGDRDVNDLLDPGCQFSHPWSGGGRSQVGVSVCDSIDDLALYLASHLGCGIPVREGWVIVEVEADLIPGARPVDPEFETLVRPTAIVSVRPVDAEFLALIAEMDAFLDTFTDPSLEV